MDVGLELGYRAVLSARTSHRGMTVRRSTRIEPWPLDELGLSGAQAAWLFA
jgi:hypothetical protein